LILAWALQQCSATALPVIVSVKFLTIGVVGLQYYSMLITLMLHFVIYRASSSAES